MNPPIYFIIFLAKMKQFIKISKMLGFVDFLLKSPIG